MERKEAQARELEEKEKAREPPPPPPPPPLPPDPKEKDKKKSKVESKPIVMEDKCTQILVLEKISNLIPYFRVQIYIQKILKSKF